MSPLSFPLPFWEEKELECPFGPWNGNWILRMANKPEWAWGPEDIILVLRYYIYGRERIFISFKPLLLEVSCHLRLSVNLTLQSDYPFHFLPHWMRKGVGKREEAAQSVTLMGVPPHGREHEGVGKKSSPLEKLTHSTKMICHLLCAKYCSKHFTTINLLNPHENSTK